MRILVLAKAPVAGLAKSRLIPALGAAGAARLQARFIQRTLATTTPLAATTELWCAPDTGHPAFIEAARTFAVELYCQQGDDLGARMSHALASGFSRGGPLVLIGTDCPAIDAEILHAAFAALHDGHDAVLGPSADGGYYLIGLNGPQPLLFSAMPWSTSRVLDETRRRLQAAALRWHELPRLHDIDTPDDLIHLPHPLKQVVSP